MTKGDILFADDKKQHFHPIVFLESIDNNRFKACILSTKHKGGNLEMQPSHFLTHDSNGNPYSFGYKNSHLVIDYSFIKIKDWVNENKVVGKLSGEGIRFVENNIPDDPILMNYPIWDH